MSPTIDGILLRTIAGKSSSKIFSQTTGSPCRSDLRAPSSPRRAHSSKNREGNHTVSTTFQSAENALTNEITRMQGLIDARDALGDLGSLEQATAEAQTRLDAARSAETTAQAELDAILQRVADAKAAAATEIAGAQAGVAAVESRS
jgi:hypothetical protein